MSPVRQIALKELEYQLTLMVGEAEVRILGTTRALQGLHVGGVPQWIVEASGRRLRTQLHEYEEDRALHQRNLDAVRKELADG